MASAVGRANVVARSGLRCLAALSSGRTAFSKLVADPLPAFYNANLASKELVETRVEKSLFRGFAAEAEPVAAGGKGAITQVRWISR